MESHLLHFPHLRRYVLLVCLFATFYTLHYVYHSPPLEIAMASTHQASGGPIITRRPPNLPSVYTTEHYGSDECESRYETQYLHNLARTQTSYCDSGLSASQLSCFETRVGEDRQDPFCLASRMTLPPASKTFKLDCQLRERNTTGLSLMQAVDQFPTYWYDTGPGWIFHNRVEMEAGDRESRDRMAGCYGEKLNSPSHTILIKREGASNLWHSMMEVFSYTLSMDALQLSKDEVTGNPLFQTTDIENTQVVLLDTHPLGGYSDLWNMLSKRPIKRMTDLQKENATCLTNVVVPLAGATNPLWLGDWVSLDCSHSGLVSVFVDRVLQTLEVSPSREPSAPLVVTFINRTGSRQLVNNMDLIGALRETYPDIAINVVDFATISLRDQLNIIQNTDILLGVHGAGLTHLMFLPPGSAVVEIQPSSMHHKGFRNLAKLRGHRYFVTHPAASDDDDKDWHNQPVALEAERFMAIMEVAIKSMYHRGLLDQDTT